MGTVNVKTAPTVTNGLSDRQIKALYCLNILQLFAMQGKTITYETLAMQLGLPSQGNALAQAISPILYDVFNFCEENNLPHLTVLVVRKSGKDRGLPGPGFWKVYGESHFTTTYPDDLKDFAVRHQITKKETMRCYDVFNKLGKLI